MKWGLLGLLLWTELQQGKISELLSRLEEEKGAEDCSHPAWESEERKGVEPSLSG